MNGLRLSKTESAVFAAWNECDEDFGYLSFGAVAEKSGVEHHKIRRAVRAIARKGLLQFARGLTNDDGEFYGAGYGLTAQGKAYRAAVLDGGAA